MKRLVLAFILCCVLQFSFAQTADSLPKEKIAVLIPLYLDSVFNGATYKLDNTSLPKYVLPGLEFYNGIMLAIERLQDEDVPVEVEIVDTRKKGITLANTLKGLENVSLLLGSFNNATEEKTAADFALSHNIPLISATYPNDAGIKGNPFFVMLNPTLKTHTEGIYRHVQHVFPNANIVYISRKGSMETRIKNDFTATGTTLKYKTLELPDSIKPFHITPALDSTKQNVIICGSLNEGFAEKLVQVITGLKKYPVSLVGMPTWDGFTQLSKKEYSTIPFIYSAAFNVTKGDSTANEIFTDYKDRFFSRPSDMVYRGYEAMYRLANLLVKYHEDLLNNLNERSPFIWNVYDLRPVKISSSTGIPDYQENKKLYFITKQGGRIISVN
ncbi:MAG: hypothetical protein JWN76_1142 [Chitinophagaceae bacterium]|nr:hypothetical protein [Chitinophagaceae bacterium]